MKTNKFLVTNKFALSDGRFVLAVANITSEDIEGTDTWELIVDHEIYCEIRIIEDLQLKGRSKRTTEKALEVSGELASLILNSEQCPFIQPTRVVYDD